MVSFYVIIHLVISMRGLYIHIPFCNRLCSFCDFPKRIKQKEEVIDLYLNKLIKEINELEEVDINTIYIGGGTPNSLSLAQLESLLIAINKKEFKDIYEYSIETNYDLITEEQVKLFKKYNINRVSIGVQTLNKDTADKVNRYCNYEELKYKISLLKENGIYNINLDFIFGLPNETISDIKYNLKCISELDVKHISYYSLIIEDKTVLTHKLNNNMISLPEKAETEEMYYLIIDELKKQGFKHYEISNFSKEGYESKHNLIYWNLDEYIGLGLSAASYYKGVRIYNSKLMLNYMLNNDIIKEEISIDLAKGEYFWLGLRKIDGVSINNYIKKFNSNPFDDFEIEELINKNLLIVENDIIKLTKTGIDFGNYVFSYFV